MQFKYFIKKASLVVFCLIVGCLYINSTTFFRFNLAKYYIKNNQEAKASLVYKKILRKELLRYVILNKIPDAKNSSLLKEVYIGLSKFYLLKNDWSSLIEEYDLWLKVFPNDALTYTKLCLVYLKEGDLLNASKTALEFKKKFNRDIFANLDTGDDWYINLGLTYTKNNLWQEAIEQWDKNTLCYLQQGERHFEKALVYENLGLQDMSIQEYQNTLGFVPNHIDALNRLSGIYKKIDLSSAKANILQTRIAKLTPTHKLEYNLGNKIRFLGYDIRRLKDGNTQFRFWFKCIAKMDVSYTIWLHGTVKNRSILKPDRLIYGYANFDHKIEKSTKDWQVGEVYVHVFVSKVNPGWYNFTFGLWRCYDGERSPIRLVNMHFEDDRVPLGWVEIKSSGL